MTRQGKRVWRGRSDNRINADAHEHVCSDEACFDHLYGALGNDIFLFAVRRLSPEAARDIVNETFEVVWRKRRQLPEDKVEWPAWVVGIARNKILQELARERRRRAVPLTDENGDEARCVADLRSSHGLSDAVLDSLVSREIYAELRDDERELFDLAHLRSLAPRDGARVLGIPSRRTPPE